MCMNYYIRKPKENSVTRKKKEKKTIDHILKLSLVLFGIDQFTVRNYIPIFVKRAS